MNSVRKLFKGIAIVAVLFLSANVVKAQQKLGHVNSGEIIQTLPAFKTAQAAYEEFAKQKQGEIQAMYTEYTTKMQNAQEMQRNRSEANRESVDAQLQQLGQELEDIERRINEMNQLAQEEVAKKEEEVFAPIFQQVNTAVQAVAKEQGYAYVFDVASQGGGILYFQGGDDITAAVKTKLGITQ